MWSAYRQRYHNTARDFGGQRCSDSSAQDVFPIPLGQQSSVQPLVNGFWSQRPSAGLLASLTSFSFFFCSGALRPQKPYGRLGTGSPGRPPRLAFTRLLSSDQLLSSSGTINCKRLFERILHRAALYLYKKKNINFTELSIFLLPMRAQ